MTTGARAGARWFPPAEFYTNEMCRRCGVCCGSTDGHPCEQLVRSDDGTYTCAIYARRLGLRQTADGRHFLCAPIKTVIEQYGGYIGCGYVEEIRSIREEMGQETDDLGRQSKPAID